MKKDDYIGASISTRMYEKNLLTRADLETVSYTHLTLPTTERV